MMLFLAGLLSSFLAGMGLGGGLLLIPLLTAFCGYQQLQAQYMCLLAYLPAAASAFPVHWKNRTVSLKALGLFVPAGLIGAGAGAYLVRLLETTVLRRLYGLLLLAYGGFLILQYVKKHSKETKKEAHGGY